MNLSSYQKAILNRLSTTNDNLLIEAVAGSGKTTTIRFCIESQSSNNQLYLVFNKSMQLESKSKFKKIGILKDGNAGKVEVRTLHSYALGILNENKKKIFKEDKYQQIIKSASTQHELPYAMLKKMWGFVCSCGLFPKVELIDNKNVNAFNQNNIRKIIEHFNMPIGEVKNGNRLIPELKAYADAVLDIYYEGVVKNKANQVDNGDMIYLCLALPKINTHHYDIIYVDESQDLDLGQIHFLRKLMRNNPATKFVFVGDREQSIYGFRGSFPSAMDMLKKDFSCYELELSVTYRCPINVVKEASKVSSKIQFAPNAKKGQVNIIQEDDLLEFVCAESYPDTIIVCRFFAPLVKYFYELIALQIPAKLKDTDKTIKKTLLNLLSELERIKIDFDIEKDFYETLDIYIENKENKIKKSSNNVNFDLEKLHDDLRCFKIVFKNYLNRGDAINIKIKNAKDFKEYVTEIFDNRHTKKGVILDSIHSVKGLEADNVFILKYNKMPFQFKNAKDWEFIQESNLQYVAVTRAKEKLFLVYEDS